MAVMAFYVYEGMDYAELPGYLLYLKPDWKKSTIDTLIFTEGLKRIPNKRTPTGQWAKAHSVVFNIVSVEIDVENIIKVLRQVSNSGRLERSGHAIHAAG